ncbi:hypothetical protein ABH931_003663 [Streptacidiphilus sp. MAP12-33]|uniref:hypothetical protein n=1 Tax=Streptacidiphilus sp. MAP12-33 TaxID=3156266 RepID=UPI003511A43A
MSTVADPPQAAAPPVLDVRQRNIVFGTIVLGMHTVFLWTVPVALLGFVVSLFLKQVKLRDTARSNSTDVGEGFAQPTGADSSRQLEYAVGKIISRVHLDTARQVVRGSGAEVDIAGAWALMEVEGFTRSVGHARVGLIAARKRVPPEVLDPVFDRMVAEGYLTRSHDFLDHTPAGTGQVQVLTTAWSEWLRDRLAEDIGRPGGAELRAAVDVIAKRLLLEDLANGLPQGRETAARAA